MTIDGLQAQNILVEKSNSQYQVETQHFKKEKTLMVLRGENNHIYTKNNCTYYTRILQIAQDFLETTLNDAAIRNIWLDDFYRTIFQVKYHFHFSCSFLFNTIIGHTLDIIC